LRQIFNITEVVPVTLAYSDISDCTASQTTDGTITVAR